MQQMQGISSKGPMLPESIPLPSPITATTSKKPIKLLTKQSKTQISQTN